MISQEVLRENSSKEMSSFKDILRGTQSKEDTFQFQIEMSHFQEEEKKEAEGVKTLSFQQGDSRTKTYQEQLEADFRVDGQEEEVGEEGEVDLLAMMDSLEP